MAKYGTFDCPDCGLTFGKTSPNRKRCDPCALKAHGETKHGFSDRPCQLCGATYKPTSTTQKVCTECAPAFRQTNAQTRWAAKRQRGRIRAKGEAIHCVECGVSMPYKGGAHTRCQPCLAAKRRAYNISWDAAHPEMARARRARAKDRYEFGGNRTKALERDGYRCQDCGAHDRLEVHHKDERGNNVPKAARNHALDNLITLCAGCHSRVHMKKRRHDGSRLILHGVDGYSIAAGNDPEADSWISQRLRGYSHPAPIGRDRHGGPC